MLADDLDICKDAAENMFVRPMINIHYQKNKLEIQNRIG